MVKKTSDETLEIIIKKPRPEELTNIFVACENEHEKVWYVAEVTSVSYEGLDIKVMAKLSRWEKTVCDEGKVWEIMAGAHSKYIIRDGKVAEYKNPESYKAALKAWAIGQNGKRPVPTRKLIDTVFGPIEERLLEVYRQFSQ